MVQFLSNFQKTCRHTHDYLGLSNGWRLHGRYITMVHWVDKVDCLSTRSIKEKCLWSTKLFALDTVFHPFIHGSRGIPGRPAKCIACQCAGPMHEQTIVIQNINCKTIGCLFSNKWFKKGTKKNICVCWPCVLFLSGKSCGYRGIGSKPPGDINANVTRQWWMGP